MSVVITGKEEGVKMARKLVLQQLQTQVCNAAVIFTSSFNRVEQSS